MGRNQLHVKIFHDKVSAIQYDNDALRSNDACYNLKGYSEIIAVTTLSIFIKSEMFAFW